MHTGQCPKVIYLEITFSSLPEVMVTEMLLPNVVKISVVNLSILHRSGSHVNELANIS